ncbi:MAG: histidine phosphatase family protein [Candidatus Sumerlaeia bacterium]|nr:histidine phosphatase family protein [Candidatus Sumerlaeia bacterium]
MNLTLFTSTDHWPSEGGQITRLYLLRHGEVAEEWRSRLYGQMDVPLSDFGRRQSKVTGRFLSKVRFHGIYSSTLKRASYLAEQIGETQSLKPQLSEHLRERRFGDWQGKPWDEIETMDPIGLRQYMANRFAMRAPGDSENFIDVCDRVLPYMREILRRHQGQTIAVTCHSGPARIVLAAALNMPMESLFSFDQDYCCLNIIDIHEAGRVRVKHLNLTTHLDQLYQG